MLNEYLISFISHLKVVRNLSPHTTKNYKRDIAQLIKFLEKEIHKWKEVEELHVRNFINKERRRGLNPRSLQRMLSSLRSFFNYLLDEEIIEVNPASEIRAPKSPMLLPKALDTDLIKKLLDFKPNGDLEIRDKAIAELLYSSGLRLSELCNLDIDSISIKERACRVVGKGNKTRDHTRSTK